LCGCCITPFHWEIVEGDEVEQFDERLVLEDLNNVRRQTMPPHNDDTGFEEEDT
tara:strand:- start:555 stop:716 length:162 start_codon:yes stop_codon:yes gene_type:complete